MIKIIIYKFKFHGLLQIIFKMLNKFIKINDDEENSKENLIQIYESSNL